MTGTKTNERPGVRAQVKYLRTSAYKAREVLNLIRGERASAALEILEFSDRDVASPILKCLESAIANAENNNGLPSDELYVSACYADEGPTLKRWRPRARGRASRIRKRTTHITIIVSRLPQEQLDLLREREAAAGPARGNRGAAEARRRRVLRSRQTKAEKKAAEEAEARAAEEHDHDDHDHDDHDHDEAPDAEAIAETADDDGAVDSTAAIEAETEVDAGADTEADDSDTADAAGEPTDGADADDATDDEPAGDADKKSKKKDS
jgi:large subunit ribosomal protein L22